MARGRFVWCRATISVLAILPVTTLAVAQETKSHPPIHCDATTDIEVRDKVIWTEGDGVVADGTCDVYIIDSRIIAGGYGVLATGSSDVVIENSYVEGERGGLVAKGTSNIEYEGTTIVGGVASSETGDLVDNGGNTVRGQVAVMPDPGGTHGVEVVANDVRVGDVQVTGAGVQVGDVDVTDGRIQVHAAPDPTALEPMDPIMCRRKAAIVIENRRIEATEDAVRVFADCYVTIRNSHIVGGRYAVLVTTDGVVEIENSVIEGGKHALMLSGDGAIHYRDSTLRGGMRSTADGRFVDEGGNEMLNN